MYIGSMGVMNEGIFTSIGKKTIECKDRLEDFPEDGKMLMRNAISIFAEKIAYFDRYEKTFHDFKTFVERTYKRLMRKWEVLLPYMEERWDSDYSKELERGIEKCNENIRKSRFKKVQGESISDTLTNHWSSLNKYDKYMVLSDCGCEVERFSDNALYDYYWKQLSWKDKMDIYVEYGGKMNEGIFTSIGQKSVEGVDRMENFPENWKNTIRRAIDGFVEDIVYRDIYGNSSDEFRSYIKNTIHKDKGWDVLLPYVEGKWDSVYSEEVEEKISKTNDIIRKTGFKKNAGESVDETLYDMWIELSDREKCDLFDDWGYDLDDYDSDCDACWNDLSWKEKMEIYVEYGGKMNEGIFTQLGKKTIEEVDRIENLPENINKYINSIIETFVNEIVYTDSYENSYEDLETFNRRTHLYVRVDLSSSETRSVIHHMKSKWDSKYSKEVDDGIDMEELFLEDNGFRREYGRSVEDTLNELWDLMDESEKIDGLIDAGYDRDWDDEDPDDIWRGIDDWRDAVIACRSMFDRIEDDYDLWWNDLSVGEKQEIMLNNYEGSLKLKEEDIDRLEDIDKQSDESEDKEFLDDLWKNANGKDKFYRYWNRKKYRNTNTEMNECDAVSPNGGLVLGDLAGMGPGYLPGPNPNNGPDGVRGSGDLPLPSGRVYQQVAPFRKFLKMKKKKKFRKKDEPCAKYDNPPIYSHVDDFREYVDRTYSNINRMK